MTETTVITRWEPCDEPVMTDGEEVCQECGWLAADHVPAADLLLAS